MKLINSCSTKYNKGGAPQQKNPGVQQTRRGTQHTHRRTSHTNIQPNQNHTNTYVRIYTYIYIYPQEYARIRQSSANEITEVHKNTHWRRTAGNQFVSFGQWSFTRSRMLSFFHLGKSRCHCIYGFICIGTVCIVST